MKHYRMSTFLAVLLSLCMFFGVLAQGQGLTISMRRDFGYSSGGGDIQGLFSITARGPDNLARVSFFVDTTLIGEVQKAPFSLQFTTDKYSVGVHQIYAVGSTSDGAKLKSQVVTANFVTESEGGQAAMKIVIPILSLSLLAVLFAAVLPLITGRKTRAYPAGAPQSYPMGGAICPKCGSPFGVHIYGMNLLTHKYDRCPYCGKWSMVKFASIEKLRAAEELQLMKANEKAQVPEASAEEKLKRELDDSKFN